MDLISVSRVQDQEFRQRLISKLAGRRFPLSGQGELTCRCNLRCVMCYTDCFNTPDMLRQELSFSEIIGIMDEIQEAGCLELTLTGGERPGLRGFLAILACGKQKGVSPTTVTTCTALPE